MNLASMPFNFLGGIIASLFQHNGELGPLWDDYRDGWRCLAGAQGDAGSGSEDLMSGCEGAWVDVALFIPMGGLYVVSQILLIHYASASYMFLATAFLLPLQNVVLSWRWAMGKHAGTIGPATFVAIAVVAAGMVMYAAATQRQTQREQERARGGSGVQRVDGAGGIQRA